MKVQIHISLKNGVLDPQGKAIENSLINLGFDKVETVSYTHLTLPTSDLV